MFPISSAAVIGKPLLPEILPYPTSHCPHSRQLPSVPLNWPKAYYVFAGACDLAAGISLQATLTLGVLSAEQFCTLFCQHIWQCQQTFLVVTAQAGAGDITRIQWLELRDAARPLTTHTAAHATKNHLPHVSVVCPWSYHWLHGKLPWFSLSYLRNFLPSSMPFIVWP